MNWFKVEPLIFFSMFLLLASNLIFNVPLSYVLFGELLLFILVGFVQIMQSRQIHKEINQNLEVIRKARKPVKKKPVKINEDLYSLLKRTL